MPDYWCSLGIYQGVVPYQRSHAPVGPPWQEFVTVQWPARESFGLQDRATGPGESDPPPTGTRPRPPLEGRGRSPSTVGCARQEGYSTVTQTVDAGRRDLRRFRLVSVRVLDLLQTVLAVSAVAQRALNDRPGGARRVCAQAMGVVHVSDDIRRGSAEVANRLATSSLPGTTAPPGGGNKGGAVACAARNARREVFPHPAGDPVFLHAHLQTFGDRLLARVPDFWCRRSSWCKAWPGHLVLHRTHRRAREVSRHPAGGSRSTRSEDP